MTDYRDDLLEYLERRFAGDPDVFFGKMMGHPGLKLETNNKFFVFVYEDGFALKLPPGLYEEALARSDFTPFQPGSDEKPMSTWVVWSLPEPEEYEPDWDLFIHGAKHYTASEPANTRGRRKR